jgi:hypothetical protein
MTARIKPRTVTIRGGAATSFFANMIIAHSGGAEQALKGTAGPMRLAIQAALDERAKRAAEAGVSEG